LGLSRIFWDTNIYIYLLEDYGPLSQLVSQLHEHMVARGDQLLTSTLTLGEVLVKPLEKGDDTLYRRYVTEIPSYCELVPFDLHVAKIYAALRADRSLRAPDAIQLACAASARVDLFITNDARLSGKIIDGIQFIVSLDRAPL
jgi:uncharacterized protein